MTFVFPRIVPIVEGPGDQNAAPVLLRRLVALRDRGANLGVARAVKANDKGALIARLERYIGHARNVPGCAAILILLDADDDCPVELSASLAERARSASYDVPAAVVCANRRYENWFLAADSGFQGDADAFGGAKGWLRRRLPTGLTYKETTNQAGFSDSMDIDLAIERSRSFRRLCHALDELIAFADAGEVGVTPGG